MDRPDGSMFGIARASDVLFRAGQVLASECDAARSLTGLVDLARELLGASRATLIGGEPDVPRVLVAVPACQDTHPAPDIRRPAEPATRAEHHSGPLADSGTVDRVPVQVGGIVAGTLVLENVTERVDAEPVYSAWRALAAQIGMQMCLMRHATGTRSATALSPDPDRNDRFLVELIDTIPQIIVVKNLDGRWVLVNKAACEWYGKPREALIGHTDHELHSPEMASRYVEEDRQCIGAQHPTTFDDQRADTSGKIHWFIKTKYQLTLPDGHAYLLTLLTDITERKSAEERVARHEQFLESLIDAVPQPLFVKNEDRRYTLVNAAFCDANGLDRTRVLGARDEDFLAHDRAARTRNQDESVLATASPVVVEESESMDGDAEIRWTLMSKALVRTAQSERFVVGITTDISGLKHAEQSAHKLLRELEASRFYLRTIINAMPHPVFVKDAALRWVLVNDACCRLLGKPRSGLIGRTDREIRGDAYGAEREIEDRCVFAGEPGQTHVFAGELEIAGRRRWYLRSKSLVELSDGTRLLVGVTTDVSGLKDAEDRLQAALQEKEVLLKEIYHRVKNNLQVVASLLQMQSRSLADPRFSAAIDDSVRRVSSMALVHEQLYRSRDLALVDFGEYMHTLVGHLAQSWHAHARGIRIIADILEAPLGIETAIPCGLIVNELVSNAFKHAFEGRAGGTVMVRFRAGADARSWVLTVGDDGNGMDAALDMARSASLGLKLVATLTEQLSGALEISRERGTVFTITFLDEDKSK